VSADIRANVNSTATCEGRRGMQVIVGYEPDYLPTFGSKLVRACDRGGFRRRAIAVGRDRLDKGAVRDQGQYPRIDVIVMENRIGCGKRGTRALGKQVRVCGIRANQKDAAASRTRRNW
jgi:hypothetical protein